MPLPPSRTNNTQRTFQWMLFIVSLSVCSRVLLLRYRPPLNLPALTRCRKKKHEIYRDMEKSWSFCRGFSLNRQSTLRQYDTMHSEHSIKFSLMSTEKLFFYSLLLARLDFSRESSLSKTVYGRETERARKKHFSWGENC